MHTATNNTIHRLRLENFRKFREHELTLRSSTVMVGTNNAGKSTLIEALRLTSFVTNRFRNLQYKPPPKWINEPVGSTGVSPSLRDLTTDLSTLFHAYSDPPAVVRTSFTGGEEVAIYIGPDEDVFAVVRNHQGTVVTAKSKAAPVQLPRLAVLHQVAPVDRNETRREEATVRRSIDSPLSPSHFRNQLLLASTEQFGQFKALAEESWPGLQIQNLERPYDDDAPIRLFVRDGPFVGELALMGHGLQMWLQVMWFLTRNTESDIVVIDEPDVYMHADLQRRLTRLVGRIAGQLIIATHSVEIMAESDPEDILVVDANTEQSRYITNVKGLQTVVDEIGGVANLQLARLANARKCLLVEGKDVQILKATHDCLFPTSESLGVVPSIAIGGWGGWERAIGANGLLQDTADVTIPCYCIFDSDYHSAEEVVDRYEKARRASLRLHVWTRKEVENYLLVPSAIQRTIARSCDQPGLVPTDNEVASQLKLEVEAQAKIVLDDIATDLQQANRKLMYKTVKSRAQKVIDHRVEEEDGLLGLVPGKKVVQAMSHWAEREFSAGFSSRQVANSMLAHEIPGELRDVVTAVEQSRPIPVRFEQLWSTRAT